MRDESARGGGSSASKAPYVNPLEKEDGENMTEFDGFPPPMHETKTTRRIP